MQIISAFPEGSGTLPELLYRLLDPSAHVDLPPPGMVRLTPADNRELDKLVAALGRNKATWRRALMLHEWLLNIGHRPDDRWAGGPGFGCLGAGGRCSVSRPQLAAVPALVGAMPCSTAASVLLCPPQPSKHLARLPPLHPFAEPAASSLGPPPCRLCTTLIRVCSQHGQAVTALAIYDWMRAAPEEGGAGLRPTVYTYTAAMRAALTGNLMDRALQVGQGTWGAFGGWVLGRCSWM